MAKQLQNRFFGELPIQIGFCNGTNHLLNALEYHRSSELDIAVTDLILLLGMQQDIKQDFTYDTKNVEAFLLPAGAGVQLYATTLHYAPVSVKDNTFQCVIVLPRETNLELKEVRGNEGEDRLLAARNKWLIAHPDAGIEGAFLRSDGRQYFIIGGIDYESHQHAGSKNRRSGSQQRLFPGKSVRRTEKKRLWTLI